MEEWADAIGVDEMTDHKPVRVAVDGEAVLLLKSEETVFAIGNQCTHQGAGLDRGVVKIAGSVRTVTCPAHGSTFNLETGVVTYTASYTERYSGVVYTYTMAAAPAPSAS